MIILFAETMISLGIAGMIATVLWLGAWLFFEREGGDA